MPYALQRDTRPMPFAVPDLHAWELDALPKPEADAILASVERGLQRTFGPGARLQHTPSGTGIGLMRLALPENHQYPPITPVEQERIRQWTFLQRWQDFQPGTGYELDRRLAWLAAAGTVPVSLDSKVQHDNEPTFAGYREGRYRVEVTVPQGWEHIGLAPGPHDGQRDRRYPNMPGESWETWLTNVEVALLVKHQWPFVIRERVLFAPEGPGTRPLSTWAKKLAGLIEATEAHPSYHTTTGHAVRNALRAVALQGIGGLYRGDGKDTMWIDPDSGEMVYEEARTPNARTASIYHPEWFSAIVARCRVSVTTAALAFPYQDILAIHTDAVITHTPHTLQDTGKVGAYRMKEMVTINA